MAKVILGVLLKERQENAKDVQQVLTKHGCIIKTRLGVHTASEDACSPQGLIILEIIENPGKELSELESELSAFKNVKLQKMEF
jgi:hypothetical protein